MATAPKNIKRKKRDALLGAEEKPSEEIEDQRTEELEDLPAEELEDQPSG